tara:strand:+ start:99 stop:398 length:300 start_codon:yes stop_codon:yes gene_type:complete
MSKPIKFRDREKTYINGEMITLSGVIFEKYPSSPSGKEFVVDVKYNGEKSTEWRSSDEILIECSQCGTFIPYEPPYPFDQLLCEKCSSEIGELISRGEL